MAVIIAFGAPCHVFVAPDVVARTTVCGRQSLACQHGRVVAALEGATAKRRAPFHQPTTCLPRSADDQGADRGREGIAHSVAHVQHSGACGYALPEALQLPDGWRGPAEEDTAAVSALAQPFLASRSTTPPMTAAIPLWRTDLSGAASRRPEHFHTPPNFRQDERGDHPRSLHVAFPRKRLPRHGAF